MTTDRSELIRDAFKGDPLVAADRERLWSATQQQITRQARAKLMVRAALLVLAGLVVAAAVFVLNAIRSPSERVTRAISIATDSISTLSPMERPMTQETPREVSQELIPLLGHRSGLQTELRHLEDRQLELSQMIDRSSGREKDVALKQLNSVEQQIAATKVAISAIDARLAGQPAVATTFAEAFPPPPDAPPQVFQFGGGSGMPEGFMWAAGGVGTFLVLAMIAMMGFMRRIARTTRVALASIESQVSSQHATLASGIDAIAVEVERLGEGQRFMSKVLSSPEAKVPVPKGS